MSNSISAIEAERIHHRDSFLNNIAQKLGRERITQAVERPKLRHNCHKEVMAELSTDELKEVLISYTQTTLASQAITTTKNELSKTLIDVCNQYCSSQGTSSSQSDSLSQSNSSEQSKAEIKPEVMLSAEVRLQSLVSEQSLTSEQYDINTWDASIGYQRNIELAERAKVGIVFAEQALAESGTMVLYSDPRQGRSVSLLPEASVFVVPKSCLVARLTQATAVLHQKAKAGERIPSCVNFISGPSSTADIELIKVVGVHGPVFATYIIIDDM